VGFATERAQTFICSFDRSKDDFVAASACCNSLITARFRAGSAQNHLYIQLSVELTQRNKVIAKLQCPSFFRDLFRIQTSEIVNPHHHSYPIL